MLAGNRGCNILMATAGCIHVRCQAPAKCSGPMSGGHCYHPVLQKGKRHGAEGKKWASALAPDSRPKSGLSSGCLGAASLTFPQTVRGKMHACSCSLDKAPRVRHI